MSSISVASQRFASLFPVPPQPSDPMLRSLAFPGDRLCDCLALDVAPAAQRLFTSPAFQDLARQPLVTLLPGCDTPEQNLINELKQAITEAAQVTESFIIEHREMLDSAFPAAVGRWRRLKHVSVHSKGKKHIAARSMPGWTPSVDEALGALQHAQSRCRDAWAAAEDYFGPRFETHIKLDDGDWIQRGEFIVEMNRELQAMGNFVARCLMVRATTAFCLLTNTTQELNVALVSANCHLPQPWQEPQRHIERLLSDLRQLCLKSLEATQVDAAICLVQIAAEFSARQPDLDWLFPNASANTPLGYLRHALRSKRDPITGQLVREALDIIDRWSTRRPQFETDVDEAIATGGLVMVEAARQVYWKHAALDLDWQQKHKLPWKLLLALAKKRGRGFVSEFDVYGEKEVSFQAYSQLKRRLTKVLPKDLSAKIVAVQEGDKAYQLCLPSKLIHVFPHTPVVITG